MDQVETDAPLKKTLRSSREALIQKAMDEPDLGQRILIYLNAFRLLIAAALLVLFAADSDPRFFGETKPTLFAATAAGYLVFAILSAISLRQRWVPEKVLGFTQLLIDTLAISLLMHGSGDASVPPPKRNTSSVALGVVIASGAPPVKPSVGESFTRQSSSLPAVLRWKM